MTRILSSGNVVGGVAQNVALDRRRGDQQIGLVVDHFLFANALAKVVLAFQLRGIAVHVVALPRADRMRRVDVRDVEAIRERLAGETGVPVVAVDEAVVDLLCADHARGVLDPLGDRFAESFLRNKVVAAARKANELHAIGDRFDRGLALELPSEDVDRVAHAGEAFGEFQHVDHLAAGVGLAELWFGGDVAVGRDHHDPLR